MASTPISSPTEEVKENPSTSRGKKRKVDSIDKDFSEAVQAFKKLCEARQQELNTIDPAAQSFAQLLTTLISEMPEQKKMRAMKAAMDVVVKIKMEDEIDEVQYLIEEV